MELSGLKEFGAVVTKLINKENLSREEAFNAFSIVLKNKTTDIHQGAFLAALTAKGETKEEIAGCWEAIYLFDTVKVNPVVGKPIVENSGTGMDSFKTFNISTAASLIAAAAGVPMARHGARALTSMCGTVDIAEALGIDVECSADLAAKSLEKSGLALFNGMSPTIHPNALGRILSQMSFGSTLNIAASLASPVKAEIGVRGVYSRDMIMPVVQVMKEIGYKRAVVMNGAIDNMNTCMDEASVSGVTHCAELFEDGSIKEFSFSPEDAGLIKQSPDELSPSRDIKQEMVQFNDLLNGKIKNARFDAAALNAGLILYASNNASSIKDGTAKAKEILDSGKAYTALVNWVKAQNRNPERGLNILNAINSN